MSDSEAYRRNAIVRIVRFMIRSNNTVFSLMIAGIVIVSGCIAQEQAAQPQSREDNQSPADEKAFTGGLEPLSSNTCPEEIISENNNLVAIKDGTKLFVRGESEDWIKNTCSPDIWKLGSGDEQKTRDRNWLPSCGSSNTLFSTLPVQLNETIAIVPLGELVPPDHTLPAPHNYVYVIDPETKKEKEAAVYVPADMVLTTIGLRHFNTIGERKDYISYTLAFSVCSDFDFYYIHVLNLTYQPVQEAAQKILQTCKFTDIDGEYCSGDVNISLKAGTIIGTAGDAKAGIYGLDVGARDYRINGKDFVNPDRYCKGNERLVFERCYTVSAFDYYPENIRSQLMFSGTPGSVNKGIIRTQEPLSGSVYQDVNGSAQGNWFKPGAQRADIAPESNDLFLGSDNVKPETKVFSVGVSVQSLAAGRYSFHPVSSGFVNRDFKDVMADGKTYCYDTAGNNGASTIIVRMLNSTMLRIKGYGSACGSGTWDFGAAYSDFER